MKKCRLLVLIALALILVWGGVSCKQEPAFYTVKFEKNADKASGEMNPQLVKSNTETQLNQNLFTRQFYVFAGWSTTEDGEVEYKDKDKVKLSSDVTLYAQWVPDKMTIKFDADDEKAQGKMDDIVANAKSLVKLTKNAFTLEGYHFDSWYDEDFKEYNDEGKYEFIKDTTLYAWWEPNTYTVKYNVNVEGSKQTMPDQEFEYDDEDFLSENTFTNPGHVFKCWNTEAEGTGTDYLDYQAVENLTAVDKGIVTLYAQWEVDDFAGTEWRYDCPDMSGNYITIKASADGNATLTGHFEGSDIPLFAGTYIESGWDLAGGILTLNASETSTPTDEMYVYISDDKKLVKIYPDDLGNLPEDFFTRDLKDGCFSYPLDMEEESETELFETETNRIIFVLDEESKTLYGSVAEIHKTLGIETYEYDEGFSVMLQEKGSSETTKKWAYKLKESTEPTRTDYVELVISFDFDEEKTKCVLYMIDPYSGKYGAYTYSKVPASPTT